MAKEFRFSKQVPAPRSMSQHRVSAHNHSEQPRWPSRPGQLKAFGKRCLGLKGCRAFPRSYSHWVPLNGIPLQVSVAITQNECDFKCQKSKAVHKQHPHLTLPIGKDLETFKDQQDCQVSLPSQHLEHKVTTKQLLYCKHSAIGKKKQNTNQEF